ncbi:unnamed protein product, partial [Closterium sp. NIES-64]
MGPQSRNAAPIVPSSLLFPHNFARLTPTFTQFRPSVFPNFAQISPFLFTNFSVGVSGGESGLGREGGRGGGGKRGGGVRESGGARGGRAVRALEALNAAWQLWPSNSNRSRRCDQWDYIQCNQQGFIVSVYVPGAERQCDLNYGRRASNMSGAGELIKGWTPGSVFSLFSRMPYLRYLVFANNYYLQGSITNLSLPPSLRMLDMAYAPLSGSLPSSIFSLSGLAHLNIHLTSLSGDLPSAFTCLSHLTYLNIGAINITGRLEDLSWLSSLTNLRYLGMSDMENVVGDLSALTFLTALKAIQSL